MPFKPIPHHCIICEKSFIARPKTLCCGKSCSATYRWRIKREAIAKEFWNRFDKSAGEDGCWIWTMGKDSKGYGKVKIQGKTIHVYRLAYELTYGEIPEGMLVRHLCNVRACGQPKHLAIGTYRDNALDRNMHGTAPRGEQNPRAKLTEDQVRWIREKFSTKQPKGDLLQVATELGVSPSMIHFIRKRKTWKHVD